MFSELFLIAVVFANRLDNVGSGGFSVIWC